MKIFQISPDDDEHSKDEEKGEGYFCSGWGRLRLGYLHWQELQGFFCLYDQIQIQIQIQICKLSFWWIFMSNALQGTSQHLSQLQKVFFISIFGTFMICTQLKPSSSLAFSQIVLWFYCRALESTQTHSPPFYFVRPRIWSHLIITTDLRFSPPQSKALFTSEFIQLVRVLSIQENPYQVIITTISILTFIIIMFMDDHNSYDDDDDNGLSGATWCSSLCSSPLLVTRLS